MLKCRHRTILFLSGTVWLLVGIFLLTLGLRFLTMALTLAHSLAPSPHFSFLTLFKAHKENAVIILVTLGLIIGYFKGKYVLSKSAIREVQRLSSFPDPTSLKNIYSKRYYILLASMMLLGMIMRYLPISLDMRGFIDVAIGSALINGSRFYFSSSLKKVQKKAEVPRNE
jgi:uncharacterized membrane protein